MLQKKIIFIFSFLPIIIKCDESQKQHIRIITQSSDPITIAPVNNNRQLIEVTRSGGAFKSNIASQQLEIQQDSALFKQWQSEVSQGKKSGTTITFVNNNDHVIIQNNKQAQTMPAPARVPEIQKMVANTAWYTALGGLMQENKMSILFGFLGLSWIAVTSKLLYASYTIANYVGWGTWYSHIAIENVYESDQAALAQKLFADIQKKYQIKHINFLTPLIHFMNDVEMEIALLKNFLHMHEVLKTIKL